MRRRRRSGACNIRGEAEEELFSDVARNQMAGLQKEKHLIWYKNMRAQTHTLNEIRKPYVVGGFFFLHGHTKYMYVSEMLM